MSRPLAALSLLPLLAAAGLPHAQGVCTDSYTVMRGDTLYSIARLCRSSVGAMVRANRLASPAGIEIGQRLAVPGRSASVPAFHEEIKEEPAPVREERPPAGEARDERGGYRIERGDTLYSLARWAGVSLRALLAANPGIDPHKIEIGDLVRLPDGARDPARARARERRAVGAPIRPTPPAPPRRPEPPAAMPPAPPAPDDESKPDDTGDEPDLPGM